MVFVLSCPWEKIKNIVFQNVHWETSKKAKNYLKFSRVHFYAVSSHGGSRFFGLHKKNVTKTASVTQFAYDLSLDPERKARIWFLNDFSRLLYYRCYAVVFLFLTNHETFDVSWFFQNLVGKSYIGWISRYCWISKVVGMEFLLRMPSKLIEIDPEVTARVTHAHKNFMLFCTRACCNPSPIRAVHESYWARVSVPCLCFGDSACYSWNSSIEMKMKVIKPNYLIDLVVNILFALKHSWRLGNLARRRRIWNLQVVISNTNCFDDF